MYKKNIFLIVSVLLISGCSVFNGFNVKKPKTYEEPTDRSDVSRVRFIGNITGTGVRTFGSEYYDSLVYDGVWGHYNSTKDIGIPKIPYRKSDYDGYYYEVYIKAGRTRFIIRTDSTLRGSCLTMFEIELIKGKDYEINFNPNESRSNCILHTNEIIKDEKLGVYTFKKINVKDVKGKGRDW